METQMNSTTQGPYYFLGAEADNDQPLVADATPTTRRFARSMHGVDAAFPNDAAYADAIDRPELSDPSAVRIVVVALAVFWAVVGCAYLAVTA